MKKEQKEDMGKLSTKDLLTQAFETEERVSKYEANGDHFHTCSPPQFGDLKEGYNAGSSCFACVDAHKSENDKARLATLGNILRGRKDVGQVLESLVTRELMDRAEEVRRRGYELEELPEKLQISYQGRLARIVGAIK